MAWIMKLKNVLFYFSPGFVKKILLQANLNKSVKEAKKRLGVKVPADYLAEIFNSVNIDSDLFVHTSLMEIGKIQGGYKEVVKHLHEQVLLKQHTLLFSALAFKGSSADYLKGIKVFDVRTAPVSMGMINEYYAMLPDAERSLSPTHSVVAVGPRADYYTVNHHLSETPFLENSPYFKIAQNKGKILMFGAGLKHLTLVHIIEDLLDSEFPYKVYSRKKVKIELINKAGVSSFGFFKAHSSFRGIFRDTDVITNPLRLLPTTKIIKLGCSEFILLDARDVVVSLLKTFLAGKTAYGHIRVSKAAKDKVEYWINYFNSL